MVLCDIGNTNANVKNGQSIYNIDVNKFIKIMNEYKKKNPSEDIYYISVNEKISKTLKKKKWFVDLEEYFDLKTPYKGLGIDRIATLYATDNGIVIDAGSATTVDVISKGAHLGGFILPNFDAYLDTYASISPSLSVNRINPNIDMGKLPLNTEDAISFGVVKSNIILIKLTLKRFKGLSVYCLGGNGKYFAKQLDAVYDETLIFKGMEKAIKNIPKN